MRPGLTLRDALLNSSELLGEKPVYRAWMAVRTIMNALKNSPIPTPSQHEASGYFHDYAHRQLQSALIKVNISIAVNVPTP